jgi:aryl-alcohol dehydrogenase-like predicted oxidoreductase
MEYTQLGRAGLKVSRLCLGAMNWGRVTEEKECFRIMDAALEAGINFIDTANRYGGPGKIGMSETIIGKWFQEGGGRREQTVLATKVYSSMEDPLDGPNSPSNLSAFKIRRHLEGSLERLATDHVELYQMHHIDRRCTWDELWEVFGALIAQGKIFYVGSSNFASHHLVTAQYEARQRGMFGLVSEQHKYNLLCRLPELEVLPAAREFGIGVIAWSPLAGGLLGGSALKEERGVRTADRQEEIELHKTRLESYSALCRELGEKEAAVGLAWVLQQPGLSCAIIGPRTVGQFHESLRALEVKLDDEILKKIDAIFPGPGGPAPEAYAW